MCSRAILFQQGGLCFSGLSGHWGAGSLPGHLRLVSADWVGDDYMASAQCIYARACAGVRRDAPNVRGPWFAPGCYTFQSNAVYHFFSRRHRNFFCFLPYIFVPVSR